MRILSFIILLAMTFSLKAGELKLGNFDLTMSKSQIISKKGKPLEFIEQADFVNEKLIYSDLMFYFSGDNLIGVFTDTPKICATNDICIGSKVSDAMQKWGDGYLKVAQGKKYLEFYNPSEFSCWYRISGSKLIKSIEIVCQP
jgi:hypothetical protein